MEYIKIENIYNRATDGSKKLIEGSFANATVEFLKDAIWQFTEKIDGTNIGIVWDGHRISVQGRTPDTSIPATLVNKLYELFGASGNEELFEQKFGETGVILFGEGYGNKIQRVGSKYRDDVSFILFDVYVPSQKTWLNRESVEDIAKAFNIEIVPILFEGNLNEGVAYVKSKPMSTIGIAPMEGVVARPKMELRDRRCKRVIVKIKAKDFEYRSRPGGEMMP